MMRWPSEQTRRLLQSFRMRTNPHAFLLTGQEGTGKRAIARLYAQALLCESTQDDRPCGKCGACQRVMHDNHPDVTHVRPGEDPDSGSKSNSITIRQIQAAIRQTARTSFEGGYKVIVIHQAERMNAAAQNALLKTLEEPPGECAFFLITERKGDLLPTVRSRCVWVPVPPLPVDTAAEVLREHGMKAAQADEAARFARGAVGYALSYAEEVAPIARRVRDALGSVRAFSDVPIAAKALTALYDEVKDPPARAARANRILESLETALRDGMERLNAPRYDISGVSLLERINNAPPRVLLKMLDGVTDARRRLNMYISWASIMDALIYSWLEDINYAASGRDQVS